MSTEGEVISGLNVLTNNQVSNEVCVYAVADDEQVNLVSSVITSVVSGVVSRSR